MKLLTADMKMADLIHSNYLLIPVINRFGIPLGYGDASVRTLCRKHGIDTDFFLVILNAFSHEDYFPEKKLQTFNVLMILEYLQKTHAYYMQTLVPTIEKLIGELLESSSQGNKSPKLVRTFFLQYKKELLAHLAREETITFPYIKKVYRLHHDAHATIAEKKELSEYSMKVYEKEHDDVDEKLYDLKNILIKYIRGSVNEAVCNAVIFELFRFEKDIKDHTRIENHILRPLVTEIERTLFRDGHRTMARPSSRKTVPAPASGAALSGTETRLLEQLEQIIIPHTPPNGRNNHENLTPREIEVLKFVARGFLNKQIADRLAISMHTVISHRKNITAKLGIKTISGLTMYALLNGLISSKESG